MRIITFFFIFFYFLITNINAQSLPVTIQYLSQDKPRKISPLFFGINSLYWIDNDQSRSTPALNEKLSALNISVIRYPGGEISDNFNWKTNSLNDSKAFPFSKNPNDVQTRMDFDEFITWKNSFGAEAIIVVNLENGLIENDLEKAANFAAEWVRYANIEKNYGIKYWEIGNESYHLDTRYATSSQQYAKALKLFSEKMKAVDPSIKIGANGPYDVEDTPLVDILTSPEIEDLRSRKSSKAKKEFKNRYQMSFIKSDDIPSWWEEVVTYAGDSFDFAVMHRYTPRRALSHQMDRVLQVGKQVSSIKSFLEQALNRSIPVAVTEYNIANQSKLEGIYDSLTMAEMIGNYLESGAFMTNYWPVRLNNRRSLLGKKDFSAKPMYHVFKAISTNVGDIFLPMHTSNENIYTFSTVDTNRSVMTLFIVNKSSVDANIDIVLSPVTPTEDINITLLPMEFNTSYTINQAHLDLQKSDRVPAFIEKNHAKIIVEPLSLTILEFKIYL